MIATTQQARAGIIWAENASCQILETICTIKFIWSHNQYLTVTTMRKSTICSAGMLRCTVKVLNFLFWQKMDGDEIAELGWRRLATSLNSCYTIIWELSLITFLAQKIQLQLLLPKNHYANLSYPYQSPSSHCHLTKKYFLSLAV